MARKIASEKEIQRYVRTRLYENREVIGGRSIIKVPLPGRNAPTKNGSNWHMAVFGGDAVDHLEVINVVIAEAQAKFNLPE
jgi:hypothetical protein